MEAGRGGGGDKVGSADGVASYAARPDGPPPAFLPDVMDGADCDFSHEPVASDIFDLEDPVLGRVLQKYTASDKDLSVGLPIGATRCLQRLRRLGHGNQKLLLLVGDKAFDTEADLHGTRDPHVVFHGCVSFMVNLHALGRYVEELGGFAMGCRNVSSGFKCAAYVLGGVKGSCKTLRRKWRATMEDFAAATFSTYQRLLREETPVPTLKSCLALLRVARWPGSTARCPRRCSGATTNAVSDARPKAWWPLGFTEGWERSAGRASFVI